jgi:hypothetical protein
MHEMDRAELNALRSQRIGGAPRDEIQHFYRCRACGQMVDKRRLGDVFHHEEAGHEPLPLDS